MGDAVRGRFAVRVERGQASEEELAALAIVLLTRYSHGRTNSRGTAPAGTPRWRNGPQAYRAPHSWRTSAT
ncbi:acyl-CoA carboxylase epsilon subunit [Streptomyces sp. NPDC001480]|uniref:acyl-CoA carboxylase epsilon subunit n=1 Tax=Streptomyces sp. NPDC001480 TaxID=3364577 RepID=UPI00367425FB